MTFVVAKKTFGLIVYCLTCSLHAGAADPTAPQQGTLLKEPDTPSHIQKQRADRVYWGDTHLHTSNSIDVSALRGVGGPELAYRFARGEKVTAVSRPEVSLKRPLDFLMVADHAEYMGLIPLLLADAPVLSSDPIGRKWREKSQTGLKGFYSVLREVHHSMNWATQQQLLESPLILKSVWEKNNAIADKFNEPGYFTAFIGYEWSSLPAGENLHRVVLFRDDASRSNKLLPFSKFDSSDPEDLWSHLEKYEKDTGGRVMAIPHNGNASNGRMFSNQTFTGGQITKEYAETRMRWEPLYEVTQFKGDGETHPKLSPNDAFADFETRDHGGLAPNTPKKEWMLKHEYARSALQLGIQIENNIQANPFKFGMIGSTDAHTALSVTREDNFFHQFTQPQPTHPLNYRNSASGLTAVWATENTREALFDAMQRKEVYATSGSRILVRLFAGWNFSANDLVRPDFAELGYARGVPMGGELKSAPQGKAPTFIVNALRDPDNANLDRIQVVKGWLDTQDNSQEQIYDIACSGGRSIILYQCDRPVGTTVDVEDASYLNTIGDPMLSAHWVDPDFDPNHMAVYYVRVLEIPKPRWSAYNQKRFGIDIAAGVRMVIQDRAYTSPVWYTP
jgi:hypothetical protein